MAYSYRPVDRSQRFLLPPDMRDWLPEGHLVWLVLDVVARVDTSRLHERHGNDGVGRRAYDPDMLLALLIYAYCTGVRSSRAIERLCSVDVAYRVVCANDGPDHTTIARFRQGHERVAQSLFVDVLAICAQAGLARVGVVAVDGTKMAGSASPKANRTRAQLEAEVAALFDAAEVADAADDGRLGDSRGDELPDDLAGRDRRRARLDRALAELEAIEAARRADEAAARQKRWRDGVDPAKGGTARRGEEIARAEATLVRVRAKAKADWEQRAARAAERGWRTPRPRNGHPEGCRVARAETHLERVKARVAARDAAMAAQPKPAGTEPMVNVTDVDSRIMKVRQGWVQGYNAQMAVTAEGVILAVAVTQDLADNAQCQPMMAATQANLDAATVADPIGTMLFDAGYWSPQNVAAPGPDRLIATAKSWKLRRKAKLDGYSQGDPPPGLSATQAMEHRLRSQTGAALYGVRQHSVEPVFGQLKFNRGFDRFMRRGKTAADAEWKLIATAHNIIKLFNRGAFPAPLT